RRRRAEENMQLAETGLSAECRHEHRASAEIRKAESDAAALQACLMDLAEIEGLMPVGRAAERRIQDLLKRPSELAALRQQIEEKPALAAIAGEEKALEDEKTLLTEKAARVQARRSQLEEGQQKLAGGHCPFFREPCRNLAEKEISPKDFFSERI